MRLVVTGATGLLGNNVVRQALSLGHQVVAVSRSATGSKSLSGLPIEAKVVNITDPGALGASVTSPVDAVIHCAAHIHLGWQQREEALEVNGNGTQNVLQFCKARRIRCVHVSTVNVLAVGDEHTVSDEETPGDGQVRCTYVVSKRAAEAESRKAISEGQDVVIVYPGFMFGPWDWKPSSGRMILQLKRGAPLMSPSGGCSIADARDVANGILTGLEKAPRGGRYIMAGENISYFELWQEIAWALGRRGPLYAMRFPAKIISGAIGDFVGWASSSEPLINSASVEMSSQFHWYSSQRAIQELNYQIRPYGESIRESIAWFREHGYLK